MAIRRVLKPTRKAPSGASGKVTRPLRKSGKPAADEDDDDATGAAGVRGAKGFALAGKQHERQQEEYEKRKEKPFAFRITEKDIQQKKNNAKLLYLDKEPFFVRLHTVKTGASKFDDVVCLADTGQPCPLCRSTGKEGSYILMLTALDRRPYRDKNNVLVKVSKKLVPVKGKNIAKFERQYNKHSTFRGLVARHERSGGKEASIGEDIEFEAKLIVEAEIRKYKELSVPAPYEKIFAPISADEMIARYGEYTGDSFGSGGGGSRPKADDADEDVAW